METPHSGWISQAGQTGTTKPKVSQLWRPVLQSGSTYESREDLGMSQSPNRKIFPRDPGCQPQDDTFSFSLNSYPPSRHILDAASQRVTTVNSPRTTGLDGEMLQRTVDFSPSRNILSFRAYLKNQVSTWAFSCRHWHYSKLTLLKLMWRDLTIQLRDQGTLGSPPI